MYTFGPLNYIQYRELTHEFNLFWEEKFKTFTKFSRKNHLCATNCVITKYEPLFQLRNLFWCLVINIEFDKSWYFDVRIVVLRSGFFLNFTSSFFSLTRLFIVYLKDAHDSNLPLKTVRTYPLNAKFIMKILKI